MEIKVRNVEAGRYVEVIVKEGSTTIELGHLNRDETKALALTLLDALYDLDNYIDLGMKLPGR